MIKINIDFLCNKLIAHRGLVTLEYPENTKNAFINSIKYNYPIELDVHILKDNNIVVYHDYNLKRLTGIDKKIESLTYEEIKKIKINKKYNIPLLKDILSIINGKVPVIIEIKNNTSKMKLERELYKIIKNYKGKYVLKSFNPLSVFYYKRKHSGVVIGQLISEKSINNSKSIREKVICFFEFNKHIKPDFYSCDVNILNNSKIIKLRKNNIILGWTVKSKKEWQKYSNLCDNIIAEDIINW